LGGEGVKEDLKVEIEPRFPGGAFFCLDAEPNPVIYLYEIGPMKAALYRLSHW
jgi:hypothetical protein